MIQLAIVLNIFILQHIEINKNDYRQEKTFNAYQERHQSNRKDKRATKRTVLI